MIRTPHTTEARTPCQGAHTPHVEGTVTVYEKYRVGLNDLEGFSHVVLVFFFHMAEGYSLHLVPHMDTVERGLFATRSPRRPNPIGLTVVRLLAVDGCRLTVAGVDMLDGTPLLDIKPYVPAIDSAPAAKCGWIDVLSRREDS